MPKLVVFSDLDGALLDPQTYSFEAAREALEVLHAHDVPLVLVSSKTRAEIEPIRVRLKNRDPFVVENGGALYVPRGVFGFPLAGTIRRGNYDVREMGRSYAGLLVALKEIGQATGLPLKGFDDMSVEEVTERTGLSVDEARLAKEREYDEPFVVEGPDTVVEELQRQAEARGLCVTKGGRFCHLTGKADKGQACLPLMEWYRRRYGQEDGVITVGIGDGRNDLPLLAIVDRPIAIQRPDGSYEDSFRMPGLIRTPGVGPIGWNRAIRDLLNER